MSANPYPANQTETGSIFEPVGPKSNYEPAKATIDPDISKSWLRRILPIILARKYIFGIALFTAFVAMMLQVAAPRVAMQAIDRALVAKDAPLMFYVYLLIGLAVTRAGFSYVYRFFLYRTAFLIEFDLRTIIYNHLTRLSFSFYDRVQSGQLISRSNSDIRALQMFLVFGPFMVISLSSFFMAFALMLTIHVKLALVSLLPLPVVWIIAVRMRKLMFPISWVVMARLADIATIVEENVTGVRVVKSFAAENHQVNLLAKAAQKLRWAALQQINIRAKYAPVMENLPRLAMALVLLYGGILAINGEVTIGTLVAFSTYVILLQAPFRLLGFLLMMSQRAAASAERIFEIMDERAEVSDRPHATDLLDPQGAIEFDNVEFSYDNGPQVLTDLKLKINPGQTVAVVGRTGSGKSTMARLLNRFYDVEGGRVLIDGKDIRDYTLRSLRSHVGMVLDEPILFAVSIRENIAYGKPDASFEDIVSAAKAAGADRFIRELKDGYDTVVGERGYTLSGGQRQRISIARTLLVNPRVLILDDATSAVDVEVEQEIHAALTTLLKGRSTLIIAHRLSTIALADQVVLLEGGKIVAKGTHAELMETEPRYVEVLAKAEKEKTDEEEEGDSGMKKKAGPDSEESSRAGVNVPFSEVIS